MGESPNTHATSNSKDQNLGKCPSYLYERYFVDPQMNVLCTSHYVNCLKQNYVVTIHSETHHVPA